MTKGLGKKKDAYKSSRRNVHTNLREMQNAWYSKKAEDIQHYADTNNTKRFCDALKTVHGTQTTGSSPLLSADGSTLFTDKAEILHRWAEHFDGVLNRSSHDAPPVAKVWFPLSC